MFLRRKATAKPAPAPRKAAAPPPRQQHFTAEDLRGFRLNREALERADANTVWNRFPRLTSAQVTEVKRRVDVMVHESAVAAGVPDDAAFFMLAAQQRLDEAAYLAQAEVVQNEAAGESGELGKLVRELIGIGRATSYVGTPDGTFYDEHHCHIRAREIGARLDQLGGMELMRAAHEQVARELAGTARARELEACWGGVGRWMR